MRIGYACLAIGVANTKQRTCLQKNASEEKLDELIQYNLGALENLIDYNITNGIKLFRISSDLIPFASSPVNTIIWWKRFESELQTIGKKIKDSGMRVSMHPGQYTVLNSPLEDVVRRAILDLDYHARVLDAMGLDGEHKIIMHIGGVYNNKKQAVERFIRNYGKLDDLVKERLVIENDDKSYDICDVLDIGIKLNIPVVFDNLHHDVNPSTLNQTDTSWIDQCKKTWQEKDGSQKIHYSQQDKQKKRGSHSNSIQINEFINFYDNLGRKDLDIMLEVKDKNLSAIKCINCTSMDKKIKALETEWSRYKYKVLENSQEDYRQLRTLLSNKREYLPITFYNLIEDALERNSSIGNSVNAAMHVWGYFKNIATEKERDKFLKDIEKLQNGKISIWAIKKSMWKLALKYQQDYLLNSYYFLW